MSTPSVTAGTSEPPVSSHITSGQEHQPRDTTATSEGTHKTSREEKPRPVQPGSKTSALSASGTEATSEGDAVSDDGKKTHANDVEAFATKLNVWDRQAAEKGKELGFGNELGWRE